MPGRIWSGPGLAMALCTLIVSAAGGCAPSAICTSDRECRERFGDHATCVLSNERGMCFTGHGGGATFPTLADGGSAEANDAATDDAGDADDGGTHDAGAAPDDGGTPSDGSSGGEDAGHTVTPARIVAFDVEPVRYFLDEGVTVSWEVEGAEACSLLVGESEERGLSAGELARGWLALMPEGEEMLRLSCLPGPSEAARVASEPVVVTPRPDVAIVAFAAGDSSDTLRVNAGSSVTVSWRTRDALACDLRVDGTDEALSSDVLSEGQRELVVTTDTVVDLACSGNGESATAQVLIEVASLDSFSADDALVVQGGSTWLRWELSRADASCTLFEGDEERADVTPPLEVTPSETTRYLLSCAGVQGAPLEASLDVRVLAIDAWGPDEEWVHFGGQTTLRWQTREAAECSLWAGDTELTTFSGADARAGSWHSDAILADTGFRLRCQADGRSVDAPEVFVRLQVTIVEAGARLDPDFEDSVKIFWRAEGTRSQQKCSLSGFGAFFGNVIELPQSNPGTEAVSEYELTCYGRSDPVVTDTARIRVWWGEALPSTAAELEDVAVVTGRLVVGFASQNEENPWRSLRDVGGNLIVQVSGVEQLDLPRLRTIGGSLNLLEMNTLRAFRAPALARVGANVDLSANVALQEVTLPELAAIGGSLRIQGSGTPLQVALDALATVGGAFELSDTQLGALSGLPSLRHVGGTTFEVTGNPQLRCEDVTALYCGLEETRPWLVALGNAQPACEASCP